MTQPVTFNDLISQSIAVLTRPRIETFERFERSGTVSDALTYVVAAALISGVVSFIVNIFSQGIGGAIVALILGILSTVIGFAVIGYLIYYIGRTQGGTGTQDEVFYSAALFVAPISAVVGVVNAVPLLADLLLPATIILGLYELYLGYLVTRSSMNLDRSRALITDLLAVVAGLIISALVGAIIGGILYAIL
jgi:Yip1 domain